MGDYVYGWMRSGYNLLQDKKEKILIYAIYVIPRISNSILDFFFENYPHINTIWYVSIPFDMYWYHLICIDTIWYVSIPFDTYKYRYVSILIDTLISLKWIDTSLPPPVPVLCRLSSVNFLLVVHFFKLTYLNLSCDYVDGVVVKLLSSIVIFCKVCP